MSEVTFHPNGNGTAECFNNHPDNVNQALFLCEIEKTCDFQGWFSPCAVGVQSIVFEKLKI